MPIVALLADQYFNPSGVGTYTRNLIKALLNSNCLEKEPIHYKLLLPIECYSQYDKNDKTLNNCEIIWLPPRKYLYTAWHFINFPFIESIVGKFDLIHILSGSVRVPTKYPCVVTIHDLASERRPQDFPWRRRWFKQKLLQDLQKTDYPLIAVSQFTKNDLVEIFKFPSSQIIVTLEGVDSQLFYSNQNQSKIKLVKEKYDLPNSFFIFLGILSPRKNVTLLLQAFDSFVKLTDNPPSLVVAGPPLSWKDKEIYQLLDSLGCRNLVKFIGFVNEDDLPSVYHSSLALVYPSLYEGFGLPILEAMACGLPVICSNSTSLPEIGGNAPLYVSGQSAEELASVLKKVANDEDLRKNLRLSGLQRISQFSWHNCAEATLAVYQNIFNG